MTTPLISSSVISRKNQWSELDLTANFQSSNFQITISGCNSEPHCYVNVWCSDTADTYITHDRLCVNGQTYGKCIVMNKGYTKEQFKSICDQWITDFILNEQ